MPDEAQNKLLKPKLALSEEVGAKAARKLRARRHSAQGVWFGLGMMGLIGWSVAIPTLLGAALGLWLDRHYPGTGLSDCLGHSSCVIGSGPFFRGSYAGNTAPVQPLCIRRNSVRSDLLDCGGDRKLPVLGWRNVLGALATILACCLGHDATDCFVRCTRDSEPDSYFDARRLID
jgi:predicted F0F1-ATPase subunit